MPQVKNKEDTWKPSELERHINAAKDDKTKSRHHGADDGRERKEKKHRDESERRHRDEDRKHRDGNEKKHRDDTDRKHRVEETKQRDDDRRHRDGEKRHRDDERRHRDENDKEKSRAKSKDPKESEKGSKHRDEDDEERRKRREERKRREAEESGNGDREHKKHRDDRETDGKRHRDRDEGEKKRDRDRDKDRDERPDDRREKHRSKEETDSKPRRREDKEQPRGEDTERRHRDGESKHRKRRDKEDEDERKDKDEKSGRRHRDKESRYDEDLDKDKKSRKHEKSDRDERKKKHAEPAEKDYSNDYADDFEAYEDDFEAAPFHSASEKENESDKEVVSKSKRSDGSKKNKTKYRDESHSEMNEILKALDEENKRLLSSSPIVEKEREEERRSPKKKKETSSSDRSTFINFVSAKQRTVTGKASKRMKTRADYLLKLIELDSASFDLYEQHPEREYDKFIRVFGRTNGAQAYVQTNEDNIDVDLQTDQIILREKWSQHPPEAGISASGGDRDESETNKHEQMINKIPWDIALEKGIQVIEMLLEENNMDNMHKNVGHKQSNIVVSEAFIDFNTPSILKGRYVTFSQFSADHNHFLLAAYSKSDENVEQSNPIYRKGVVCIWNVYDPGRPQKILIAPSHPRSCCFSPNKPTLAFAGLDDGVVVLWDLREPNHQHRSIIYDNQEHVLRNPTYNTAMPYMHDSHSSPVIRIAPIVSSAAKGSTSTGSASEECLSYQLASLEQNAVVVLWVVVELSQPEPVGSTSDFGLRDRGRVKLIKSSVIRLESPKSIRISGLETTFESTDLQVWPQDNSHIIIGTAATGCVLHASRFGNRLSPKTFRPTSEYPFDVTSIDFSPFLSSVFLAGGSDGSLRLFRVDLTYPLMTWQDATEGRPVRMVRWCRSRPSVFFVLDEDSFIHIWDLHMDDSSALKKERIAESKVTSVCLSNDHRATGQGLPDRPPQMVVFLENGVAEAHIIKKEFSALMPEEKRQFSAFIEKAIL